jgi:hypothetical protein
MRQYTNGFGVSHGQRVVAGLGSDRISLFRGEIFAGVHKERFSQKIIRDSTAPVFGGKIYWYPTRAWVLNLSLDQTYSDTSVPTPLNPNGFPKRSTSVAFNARYQMARDWNASFRSSAFRSKYFGTARRDNGWNAGFSVNYDLLRNLALTFDLDHYRMSSTDTTAGYTHSIYKLGAKYRY